MGGHAALIPSPTASASPAVRNDAGVGSGARTTLPASTVDDHANGVVADWSDPSVGSGSGVGVDDAHPNRMDDILSEDRRGEEKCECECGEALHYHSSTQTFWVPLLAIASMIPV